MKFVGPFNAPANGTVPCVGEGNMGFKDKVKGGHVAHASEDIMMAIFGPRFRLTIAGGWNNCFVHLGLLAL